MALACVWIVWNNLAGTAADQALETQPQSSTIAKADALRPSAASAYGRLATALTAYALQSRAADTAVALFDSRFLGFPPSGFAKSAAQLADAQQPARHQAETETTQALARAPSKDDQAARSAASPAHQPSLPPTRTASVREAAQASRAPTNADRPWIFEKLFGKPAPVTLAYASPEDGTGALSDGQGVIAGRYDRQTAVYDISAHTVYLPDGTKLEAHSGLGSRLDDPRYTDERMRGSTPATVYDLKMREAPFHGVRALRLIPVDEEKVFGRAGLLAHTYMLGPSGQSFGCVSFRDYNAFLQAYLNHEIKRLAVVSRLD